MEFMEGYELKKDRKDDDEDKDLDLDDDEWIKEYREKWLEELKGTDKEGNYRYVKHITKQDFQIEVTDAPKGTWVVILLYQDYVPISLKIVEIFNQLQEKYPEVKFLKSIATKTIENYRDSDVPGILIYKDGDLV